MSGKVGRVLVGLLLFLQLALPLALPRLANLNRDLVPVSLVHPTWFSGSFRTLSVDIDARPGPLPRVHRFSFPQEWLNSDGQSTPPLAVYIDDRRAAWLPEEPYFELLGPDRIYAYRREAASLSFFVVCKQDPPCRQVEFVRDDFGARIALAAASPGVAVSALARLGMELTLALLLTWLVLRHVSGRSLVFLLLAETWLMSGSDPDPLRREALPAFALALAWLLLAPAFSMVRRGIGWIHRVIQQPPGVDTPSKAAIFAALAIVSAWPGWRTAQEWYPGENHDSQFYLFAASRFLRTSDLFPAIIEPDSWRYTVYPLILAVFSKLSASHPMDSYLWVSILGACAMTAAAGAVAWFATGRFSTSLVATWISGTWGGLGGWAWLCGVGAAVVSNGPVPEFGDDYYEPRFFGEFTGPYSELATYLTSAPFYPREAGLVPFWLALGLLYRRLQPQLRSPPLTAIGALFLLSASIYPYYGLAAALAFGVAAVGEGAGGETMRRQRNRTIVACFAIFLPVLVIADVASRVYRNWSVWAWLSHFLDAVPLALDADHFRPSLDFLAPRILGGEFFFALAFVGAIGLGRIPKDSLSEPQRRAIMASLGLCLAHGVLTQSNSYLHLLSFNFRWLVSWRTLLTPILSMVAALFIEQVIARSSSGRSLRLAVLTLLPALSGFVWSAQVTSYMSREQDRGSGRGSMASLWSEYSAHGRSLLGRVLIPEPMLIESTRPGERSVAAAAFGIGVTDIKELGGSDAVSIAAAPGLPLRVESAALQRNSLLAGRIRASGCCERLTSYGVYDIFVRRKVAPPAPTR